MSENINEKDQNDRIEIPSDEDANVENASLCEPSGSFDNEVHDPAQQREGEEQAQYMPQDENQNLQNAEDESVGRTAKPKISIRAYLLSTISIVIAAVMLTYTICSGIYKKEYIKAYRDGYNANANHSSADLGENPSSTVNEKQIIDLLLDQFYYGEISEEERQIISLKAYLASIGDPYAAYYTKEEYAAITQDNTGKMSGIGVSVIDTTIPGTTEKAIKIINVFRDSPALESGLMIGDYIRFVGSGDDKKAVDELGFEISLNSLRGEENTYAEFEVARPDGDTYKKIEFKIKRRTIKNESVTAKVSTTDPSVGIIRISEFDLTTPDSFKASVLELREKDCTRFVLDLRYNPGGLLVSVRAMLSYFLDEGDVYIRVKDKKQNVTSQKIELVNYTGDYSGCSITKEDIGMFKDLDMVVLCNENTASAAELFTASVMDYELGVVVGAKTFGKGKMQNFYSLAEFGFDGAVKFTTHMYFSAKSEGYDGIGITPDIVVEQSEEAKAYKSFYELPEDKDNQLKKAIETLN